MSETDEAFLERITKVRYVPVLERLIAMARRPSRNDVLEEAAKYHDRQIEVRRQEISDIWSRCRNKERTEEWARAEVSSLESVVAVHSISAAAIRALKEPT